MKDTIINLTPPIDGVKYGISTELIKEGDEILNILTGSILTYFKGFLGGSSLIDYKKVILSTNPKDTRFPYLQLPSKDCGHLKTDGECMECKYLLSKEQEVERLAESHFKSIGLGNPSKRDYDRFKEGHNANPAKYTQEQMEKAIKLAREEECNGGVKYETFEIIQSLQPTAKAVRVEMEENQCDGCKGEIPVDGNNYHRMGKGSYVDYMYCQKHKYNKIKVETSSEYPQGLVKALEVIY